MTAIRLVTLIGAALIIVSCGGKSPAPVISRQPPPSEKIQTHIVSKGDTLFNIAWRYELDLQRLAMVNGLSRPYTIYVGQQLVLDTSKVPAVARQTPIRPSVPATPPSQRPQPSQPQPPQARVKQPAVAAPQPSPKIEQPASAQKAPAYSSNWQWQWPVKGRVIRHFGAVALFKGIDISSLPGAPVYPAAPGVVVYSGDGLRGYGNLIIVKHNEVFLSAYAHNRKIFVKEKQTVEVGQKIAEVGGDPANVRRFYFEIRKDGKPVDPLKYLP